MTFSSKQVSTWWQYQTSIEPIFCIHLQSGRRIDEMMTTVRDKASQNPHQNKKNGLISRLLFLAQLSSPASPSESWFHALA
jgi:hypothetical protein